MFKKLIWIILLFPAIAFSESTGEKLINRFWQNTVEKRFDKIDSTISFHFQGMHINAITRQKELQYLRTSNITNFVVSNVLTTKNKQSLIVTYDIQLFKSITTAYLPKNLDPISYYHEIFVYSKYKGTWKLVSLSFFSYIPAS